MSGTPSITQTLSELDGGSLDSMASHALRLVAESVRDLDGKAKGKLSITLTIERTKGSGQLLVSHKVSFSRPTETGRATEDASGDTLMYIDAKGALSVTPSNQLSLLEPAAR
jgi:hypothetical protein